MKERFQNAPWPIKGLFFLVIGFLFILVFSSLVYFLWNAILPKISPLKEITLLQAAGLLILSKILFSSMHWGGRGRKHRRNGGMHHWKNKWSSMSEEDKMRMKERWKERCARKEEKKHFDGSEGIVE